MCFLSKKEHFGEVASEKFVSIFGVSAAHDDSKFASSCSLIS